MTQMTNKTKASTPTPPSYVEVDPSFDLKKEDALETLIIQLPGFKKEQLRAQVNKNGDLKVSGERPISADGSKRSRFLKEVKIQEGCDVNNIRAKFNNGHLDVTMPKKVNKAAAEPQAVQQQPAASASSSPKSEVTDQKRKDEDLVSEDQNAKDKINNSNENFTTNKGNHMFEHEGIVQMLQGKKRVVLGSEIAAVTMIAIGAFVAYNKYGTDSISFP